MDHLYTREQAEELLPLLTELLTELRDRVEELEQIRARLDGLPEAARQNGYAVEAARLERRAADVATAANDLIAQVQELEVEIKDLRTGLVDFRTLREGRVVYLCWRLGEPRIDFWHEVDAGFAGRQPLD